MIVIFLVQVMGEDGQPQFIQITPNDQSNMVQTTEQVESQAQQISVENVQQLTTIEQDPSDMVALER